MIAWDISTAAFQTERHFGNRDVACLRDRPSSLPAMLRNAARENPEGEALVCGDFRCTWAELDNLSRAFALHLRFRGILRGDRVAMLLGNRPEFVIALYAITRLGAVAVPVGIREQAPGLAYITRQSGARLILHEPSLTDILPPDVPALAMECGDTRKNLDSLAQADGSADFECPKDDDTALIMYTSGTTGQPKGALVAHVALVHVGAIYAMCMDLDAADRSVCVVPLSHITGITATLCAMAFARGCSIIIPQFEAEHFVRTAECEAMTHTLLVPAMYKLILDRVNLASYDLSRWRIGAFGGAPMPVPTIVELKRKLPALDLMNCYGATETCGAVTIMPAEHAEHRSGSVGFPVPGTSFRVIGEGGEELGPDQEGELCIAGPTVAPGYWGNPDATAASFDQGFWQSGDLGKVDEDGFVYVLDRLKDMINRGGYKIFTAEVESVLAEHPSVTEAALIAMPCPVLGERVHAFVSVPLSASCPESRELQEFCAARMADYKVPESFTIGHDPLPRNLNGKILKKELRKTLEALPSAPANDRTARE